MPAFPKSACVVLFCLLATSHAAVAGVYSCKTANGVTFQDSPCTLAKAPENKPKVKKSLNSQPAGIHKSWMEKPLGSRYSAWCDINGCECGPYDKAFDAGAQLAVADALYLDGSWHRYDNLNLELLAEAHDATKKFEISTALEEASCEIMMSQKVIKKFTRSTLKELKSIKIEAEARGYDTPDACDGSDFIACDYYSKVELYQRMMQDIKALKMPRDSYASFLE